MKVSKRNGFSLEVQTREKHLKSQKNLQQKHQGNSQ